MPGRIGPLVTTGVALSVAAAVVANPVVAPRPDLQVPAVQLSGNGDDLDMLNTDFLSAIGPAPTEASSNPFVVLKDLVASLAADASYLGRNAIVAAFFAGATAVTRPELTAVSTPFTPYAPTAPFSPVPPVTPHLPELWLPPVTSVVTPIPVTSEDLLAVAAAVPDELVPAAAEMILTLIGGVEDLGESAVTTAFAAGALLVSGGVQVIDTLRAVVGDPVRALQTAITAVTIELPKTFVEVIQRIVELATPRFAKPIPETETSEISGQPSTSPESSDTTLLSVTAPAAAVTPEAASADRRKPGADTSAVLPSRVSAPVDGGVHAPSADLPDDIGDLAGIADPVLGDLLGSDEADTAPSASTPRKSLRTAGPDTAFAQAQDQARAVVGKAVDAVRKATDRAGGAASAPAGD